MGVIKPKRKYKKSEVTIEINPDDWIITINDINVGLDEQNLYFKSYNLKKKNQSKDILERLIYSEDGYISMKDVYFMEGYYGVLKHLNEFHNDNEPSNNYYFYNQIKYKTLLIRYLLWSLNSVLEKYEVKDNILNLSKEWTKLKFLKTNLKLGTFIKSNQINNFWLSQIIKYIDDNPVTALSPILIYELCKKVILDECHMHTEFMNHNPNQDLTIKNKIAKLKNDLDSICNIELLENGMFEKCAVFD